MNLSAVNHCVALVPSEHRSATAGLTAAVAAPSSMSMGLAGSRVEGHYACSPASGEAREVHVPLGSWGYLSVPTAAGDARRRARLPDDVGFLCTALYEEEANGRCHGRTGDPSTVCSGPR